MTGLSWVYRDYSLYGRHSVCRPYRQAYIIITDCLCQPPFFDGLLGPLFGPAEGEPGQGPGAPGAGPRRRRRGPRRATTPPPPPPRPPAPRRGAPVPRRVARRRRPRRPTTPHPGGMHQGAPGRPPPPPPEAQTGKQNICFVQAEGARPPGPGARSGRGPGADRPLGRGTKRIFCLRRRRGAGPGR